jgi:deaminated glutathione amidase
MKIALVQMQSTGDLERNLRAMERLTAAAAARGSKMVVFPEMAYFTGHSKDCPPVVQKFAQLMDTFASWARLYKIALLPGSIREPSPAKKQYNTLAAFGPDGKLLAAYRKIFLFRATLTDRAYNESAYTEAGQQPCVFRLDGVCFGLSICYDLRFPELFRSLKKAGADLVFVPAAFTVPTGRAHWETLLRARAIENQMYVAAPGLVGRSGNGAQTYGHSLVVDPWGKVRPKAANRPTTLTFDYDPQSCANYRSQLDAWASRREDLFPIR